MNEVMDQIIESLAFEIEAVPNQNKGQVSTGLNGDPINVKIRIRNKDQNKIVRQGIITIPKKDAPIYNSEKIQLSNSDQTIMSFNVLMEQDMTKQVRKQKRKFRFFKRGSCLGNQTDDDNNESKIKGRMDDDQFVPIKSTSIYDINKRNFTLTKNYDNSNQTGRVPKRTHKDILGECKPGGCLDPPYGEEKYSYVPKLIQTSKTQKNSTKLKTTEKEYRKPLKKNTYLKDKDEMSYVLENKEQSLYSNSIITYPSISSNDLHNQDNIQKAIQSERNGKNNNVSTNSNEIVETYFISPKKIKLNKFQGDTNSLSDLEAEKATFENLSSQDEENMDESKPKVIQEDKGTGNTEGILFDSKIQFQKNNEKFEKVDTNLKSHINSSVELNDKIALNLKNTELSTKDLINNTINIFNPETEFLKVFSDTVTIPSTTPRTSNEIVNNVSLPNTKSSIEDMKDNKLKTGHTFDLETFKQDSCFLKTKLDNEKEMTNLEKEINFETDTGVVEPLRLTKSEEVKYINEFADNESSSSSQSFPIQKENVQEIYNFDSSSIIPNALILMKRNSSNLSVVNNEVLHQNNIATLNEDLTSLKNTKHASKSSSNENINKSSSFNQKVNIPDLEQIIYEPKLLDSEINSNLLPSDVSYTKPNDKREIKDNALTQKETESNSKLSNDLNDIRVRTSNIISTNPNLIPLALIEENSTKIDQNNFMSDEANVKSDIENSALVIDSQETVLSEKTQSNPSLERDLNRLNDLKDNPTSTSKDFDSPSNLDRGFDLSVNTDIATYNKDVEDVQMFSRLNSLKRDDDSFTKEIRSGSNVSLLNKKHANTLPLEEFQLGNDKDETDNDVSMDDATKLQNEDKKSSITIQSINKVDLQNSKETSLTLHDENLNNDLIGSATSQPTDIKLKNSKDLLNMENNDDNSKNEQFESTTPNSKEIELNVSKDSLNTEKRFDNFKTDQFNLATTIPTQIELKVSTHSSNLGDNIDNLKKNQLKSAFSNSNEMGLNLSKGSLILENIVNSPTNDEFNDSHATVTHVQTDLIKKDEHNFITSGSNTNLSKSNNEKDTIYLNMAFQSFCTKTEGNIIRTLETSDSDVKRYAGDNILQFKTLARFDDDPITIPLDKDKNLLLQIVKTQRKENQNREIMRKQSVSPKHETKHKLVIFDEDKDGLIANSNSGKQSSISPKKNGINNIKSKGSLHQTLDNVYNEKLLPLHNIIKDLKSDVDGLLQQKLLIKNKLRREKEIQLHQISKNNIKCFCVEQILKY